MEGKATHASHIAQTFSPHANHLLMLVLSYLNQHFPTLLRVELDLLILVLQTFAENVQGNPILSIRFSTMM